jgi:hypoxanthine phosphoribosyltransferase
MVDELEKFKTLTQDLTIEESLEAYSLVKEYCDSELTMLRKLEAENLKTELYVYEMSWYEYEQYLNKLAENIKNKGINELEITKIIGIARGGIIPAVHLSHMFNIPYINYEQMLYYGITSVDKYLFVDDIVHSGKTLDRINFYVNNDKKHRFVSLIKNDAAPTDGRLWTYGGEIGKNCWIIFPWEKKMTIEEVKAIIKKHVSEKLYNDIAKP